MTRNKLLGIYLQYSALLLLSHR